VQVQLKDIKIGVNFEISIFSEGQKTKKSYPVKLQNIYNDNRMEIDVPFSGGQMILFQVNNLIEVVTINDEGVFAFKARILERGSKNHIPMMIIRPESELEKRQRRAYYRLMCNCNVRYRKFKIPALGENDEVFKTTMSVDISGGGIGILADEKLDTNDFYECVIILDKDVEINVVCKPVSIKKDDVNDKYWKIGMKFERIQEQAREKTINYIFQEQLKLRRKGLV